MGDCELTDWVAGPCTVECGPVAGAQNITREVISVPDSGKCPPLRVHRTCNHKPCPMDCQMGEYSEWSVCTQSCGGGTRSRTRNVVATAQNGGLPCGNTVQE